MSSSSSSSWNQKLFVLGEQQQQEQEQQPVYQPKGDAEEEVDEELYELTREHRPHHEQILLEQLVDIDLSIPPPSPTARQLFSDLEDNIRSIMTPLDQSQNHLNDHLQYHPNQDLHQQQLQQEPQRPEGHEGQREGQEEAQQQQQQEEKHETQQLQQQQSSSDSMGSLMKTNIVEQQQALQTKAGVAEWHSASTVTTTPSSSSSRTTEHPPTRQHRVQPRSMSISSLSASTSSYHLSSPALSTRSLYTMEQDHQMKRQSIGLDMKAESNLDSTTNIDTTFHSADDRKFVQTRIRSNRSCRRHHSMGHGPRYGSPISPSRTSTSSLIYNNRLYYLEKKILEDEQQRLHQQQRQRKASRSVAFEERLHVIEQIVLPGDDSSGSGSNDGNEKKNPDDKVRSLGGGNISNSSVSNSNRVRTRLDNLERKILRDQLQPPSLAADPLQPQQYYHEQRQKNDLHPELGSTQDMIVDAQDLHQQSESISVSRIAATDRLRSIESVILSKSDSVFLHNDDDVEANLPSYHGNIGEQQQQRHHEDTTSTTMWMEDEDCGLAIHARGPAYGAHRGKSSIYHDDSKGLVVATPVLDGIGITGDGYYNYEYDDSSDDIGDGSPRRGRRSRPIASATEYNPDEKLKGDIGKGGALAQKFTFRKRVLAGVICVGVIIGIVIGIIFGIKKDCCKSPTKNESVTSSMRRSYRESLGMREFVFAQLMKYKFDEDNDIGMKAFLTDWNSTKTMTNSSSSPYVQALNWIINVDPMQLEHNFSPNFLQRYILAYYYYATTSSRSVDWKYCGPPPPSSSSPSRGRGDKNETSFNDTTTIPATPTTECNLPDFENAWAHHSDDSLMVYRFMSKRWLSEFNECDWLGVLCNKNGQVIQINLSTMNMTSDSFPVGIVKFLPFMTDYAATYNPNLIGPMPSKLIVSQWKHLVKLQLQGNNMSGPFPSEFVISRNLKSVRLYDNRLSGTLPTTIGLWKDLKGMYVGNNLLNGSIPTAIGAIGGIDGLKFNENSLTGSIPSEVTNLVRMRILHLSKNKLNGSIPSEIGRIINMTEFSIGHNQITGSIPDSLYNATKLQLLSLEENYMTGTISPKVGTLENLIWVYLNDNDFDGTLPTEMGELKAVQDITLNGNNFTGAIPNGICLFQTLEMLYADCLIDDSADSPAGAKISCPDGCCTTCCDHLGNCL